MRFTKIPHIISFFDENVNFGHFKLLLAYFGLSWPQYQCSKILISESDIVLTGLSEIGKKMTILAIKGHF